MTLLASRNPTLQKQCYLVLPGLSRCECHPSVSSSRGGQQMRDRRAGETSGSTSESATKSTKRGMYEKYTPKEKARTSCYAWYHSHNKASPCLAKLCSDHEIFNTKIKNFANFECFTKFLCLENLELYGILPDCLSYCLPR